MRLAFTIFLAVLAPLAFAKSIGPTYPIAEPDMLEQIMAQLRRMEASGDMKRLLDEGNRRAIESITRPKPVAGLSVAGKPRSFLYDPSIVVTEDIAVPELQLVVARRGDRINPLDHASWPRPYVFFDGTDPDQVRFVSRLVGSSALNWKLVMVGGDVRSVSKQLGKRVYFDQAGHLVSTVGIRAVPATLRQEGNRLRIDEIPAGGVAP